MCEDTTPGDTNPKASPRLIEHVVKPYENLHILAGYYLLNARRWHEVYEWNREEIKNKNTLYPGQVLKIWVDPEWSPPYNLDEFMKDYVRTRKAGHK
jgi:hypothetical protein